MGELKDLPIPVNNLRLSVQVDTFLQDDASSSSMKVVLIELTDAFDTSLMVKTLAFSLNKKVAVAEVRASNNALAKEFGLGAQPQYPIILALCAENGKLAGLMYEGDYKRKNIESWLDKSFLGKKRALTCKKLRNAEAAESARRYKQSLSAQSMSLEELQRKRVKQLREIADDLQIKTDTLREKEDFVQAIFYTASKSRKASGVEEEF